MSGLRRSGKIEIWNDNQIELGTNWSDVIKDRLRQADIIILLLSDTFLASDHIWDTQLKESLSRRDKGEALMLIPVLVRSCDLKHTVLNKIQGLPRNKRAISLHQDVDEAWYNIAVEISKITENFGEVINQASHNTYQSTSESLHQAIGNNNITPEGIIMIGMSR